VDLVATAQKVIELHAKTRSAPSSISKSVVDCSRFADVWTCEALKKDDHGNRKGSPAQIVKAMTEESGNRSYFILRFQSDWNLLGNFFKAIVSTYRSFMEPSDFLDILVARFSAPPETEPAVAKLVKFRTSVAFKFWVKNYFFDFDEALLERLLIVCEDIFPKIGLADLAENIASTLESQVPLTRGYLFK